MTLNQLRAFLATVRTGSFTAAAEQLGVAQASISELIRRVEDDFGVALFTRSKRRLVLTAAGIELLPFAEAAVEAAEGGTAALRSTRALRGGVATFGLLRNASYYSLADLAERFHERHPDVRIRLVGLNSVEVVEAIKKGELEAGLVVLPIDQDGLSCRPLRRDEVLYVSADPSRTEKPVTVERLALSSLILYDAHYGWRDPTRRQLRERAVSAGVTLEPLIEVEHVEAALPLVSRGVGDTLLCRAIVDSAGFPPGLSVSSLAEPLYDTIAFVQRSGATLSPATREMAALATAMLTEG